MDIIISMVQYNKLRLNFKGVAHCLAAMGVKGVLLIFCLHWFACVLCTHWPIGPTRYDERPPVDKYCAKLSKPFCPEGAVQL